MSTHAFSNPFQSFNPFLVKDEPAVEESAPAVEGPLAYALVQSGPSVSSEEVESHLDAIEVTVRWGSQILSMKHLNGGESFFVGEGSDFELPEGVVDGKLAIVDARAGATYACLPRGSHAVLTAKNASAVNILGGQEIALPPDAKLLVSLASDITIEIATVRAGKKIPIGFMSALATGAMAAIGLSFVGHAAIVASLAMFMPNLGADDAEATDRNQMLAMQKLMAASAEREQDPPKDTSAGNEPGGGSSEKGEKHKGPEGAAGTPTTNNTSGRMAFKGDNEKPALTRKDEMALAADFGMIGMIKTGSPKDAPSTPWAEDQAAGSDPLNAKGHIWGNTIDDAFGYGVGMSGTGEGGGGDGKGVGINGVGTIGGGNGGPGHGFGTCKEGPCDGMGIGHGPGKGTYVPKKFTIREPNTTTNGRLPPEVIQRVVRQNFGRFRLCYENALRTNPGLNGRVVTKFVIDRNGSVSMAQDGGSDMPSQEVTSCIVRSFQSLSVPQPEGGIATVTYPLVLNPGE